MSAGSITKLLLTVLFGALAAFFAVSAFFNSAEVANKPQAERQWKLSKLDVIDLVKQGKWDVLEKEYTTLHQKFEKGQAHWTDLSFAFGAFDFADPNLQAAFSNWVKAKPESFIAYAARGIYLSHLGFATRGSKTTDKTHPEQIKGMVKYLQMSVPDLSRAIEINPDAIMAYARMMEIAMFGGDYGGVWQTYIIGYFRTTDATVLTRRMATVLQPKWGGDPFHRILFQKFALIAGLFDSGFRDVRELDGYIEAESATYNRDYETALALWTNVLTTNKSADVHLRRAWVLRKLDREEEALKDILTAIEKDPDDNEGYEMAADIYMRSKWKAKALPYYDMALKLNPYKPKSLIGRAYVLLAQKRFEEAVRDLDDTLVFGQWTPHVHWMRAQYLGNRRANPAKAKESYIRLFELEPDNERYYRQFMWFLQYNEDCDYFRYVERYLELCLRNQTCGRDELDRQRWMANTAQQEGQCRVDLDLAKFYGANFPALTNLDDVSVAELKLGQGQKEILAAYPKALITPVVVDKSKKPALYEVKYGSIAYPPRIVMFMTTDDRIFSIQVIDIMPFEGDFETIEKKYIEKYGPPDSRRSDTKLELEYRQAGEAGKYAKTLTITFRPYRDKNTAGESAVPDRIQIITLFVDVPLRDSEFGLDKRKPVENEGRAQNKVKKQQ